MPESVNKNKPWLNLIYFGAVITLSQVPLPLLNASNNGLFVFQHNCTNNDTYYLNRLI